MHSTQSNTHSGGYTVAMGRRQQIQIHEDMHTLTHYRIAILERICVLVFRLYCERVPTLLFVFFWFLSSFLVFFCVTVLVRMLLLCLSHFAAGSKSCTSQDEQQTEKQTSTTKMNAITTLQSYRTHYDASFCVVIGAGKPFLEQW